MVSRRGKDMGMLLRQFQRIKRGFAVKTDVDDILDSAVEAFLDQRFPVWFKIRQVEVGVCFKQSHV